MSTFQFAFKRVRGNPNIRSYAKKASTAISMGQVVAIDSNGFLIPATASTTGNDIVGIAMETIATTDSDYTSTRDVAVDVVEKGGEEDVFEAVVGTGTAAQTTVGEAHDLDGSTPPQVDQSATTTKVLKVVRFITATKVWVCFLNTGDLA